MEVTLPTIYVTPDSNPALAVTNGVAALDGAPLLQPGQGPEIVEPAKANPPMAPVDAAPEGLVAQKKTSLDNAYNYIVSHLQPPYQLDDLVNSSDTPPQTRLDLQALQRDLDEVGVDAPASRQLLQGIVEHFKKQADAN
jgi:hypothetical protein